MRSEKLILKCISDIPRAENLYQTVTEKIGDALRVFLYSDFLAKDFSVWVGAVMTCLHLT